jgi:hypothetical protein
MKEASYGERASRANDSLPPEADRGRKELQRIDNERWANAEKEADERIAAREASPPPRAASR